MNIHFGFELALLRARQRVIGDRLRRLEEENGIVRNQERENGVGAEEIPQNGGGGGGGGGGEEEGENRGGGGGGGGGGENPIINELRDLNLDDRAMNTVRGAILDNASREEKREIDALRLEQKRQNTQALQRERRLIQIEVEKATLNNERRDIKIEEGERELEIVRRQLQAERDLRHN